MLLCTLAGRHGDRPLRAGKVLFGEPGQEAWPAVLLRSRADGGSRGGGLPSTRSPVRSGAVPCVLWTLNRAQLARPSPCLRACACAWVYAREERGQRSLSSASRRERVFPCWPAWNRVCSFHGATGNCTRMNSQGRGIDEEWIGCVHKSACKAQQRCVCESERERVCVRVCGAIQCVRRACPRLAEAYAQDGQGCWRGCAACS